MRLHAGCRPHAGYRSPRRRGRWRHGRTRPAALLDMRRAHATSRDCGGAMSLPERLKKIEEAAGVVCCPNCAHRFQAAQALAPTDPDLPDSLADRQQIVINAMAALGLRFVPIEQSDQAA